MTNTYLLSFSSSWDNQKKSKLAMVRLLFTAELVIQFSSVQSLSRVWLFATPWIAARQASLSITELVIKSTYIWPIPPSLSCFAFSCLSSLPFMDVQTESLGVQECDWWRGHRLVRWKDLLDKSLSRKTNNNKAGILVFGEWERTLVWGVSEWWHISRSVLREVNVVISLLT